MAEMLAERPAMAELHLANQAIGDRAALDTIMAEHGYWFFRDVLDTQVVGEMRDVYLDVLADMGVVDRGAAGPAWNGAPLDAFPEKIEALHQRRLWQDFVSRPTINAFFERLFGEPVFWVPSVEYRITPPRGTQSADPFTGRHQDGFANAGMDFLTCWVPLVDIDARMGGLAVADGLNKGPILHDPDDAPLHRIPPGTIPDTVWHRSDYHPGDLVMFCPTLPHSGMTNASDAFRLSMDVRVMPRSAHIPVVGTLKSISMDRVTIEQTDGGERALILDSETYCRGQTGARIALPDMLTRLHPGDAVMASERGGHALMLRPQR